MRENKAKERAEIEGWRGHRGSEMRGDHAGNCRS